MYLWIIFLHRYLSYFLSLKFFFIETVDQKEFITFIDMFKRFYFYFGAEKVCNSFSFPCIFSVCLLQLPRKEKLMRQIAHLKVCLCLMCLSMLGIHVKGAEHILHRYLFDLVSGWWKFLICSVRMTVFLQFLSQYLHLVLIFFSFKFK